MAFKLKKYLKFKRKKSVEIHKIPKNIAFELKRDVEAEKQKQQLLRLKIEEKESSERLQREKEALALQLKKKKQLEELKNIQKQEKELADEHKFSTQFKKALSKELSFVGSKIKSGYKSYKESKKKQSKSKGRKGKSDELTFSGIFKELES